MVDVISLPNQAAIIFNELPKKCVRDSFNNGGTLFIPLRFANSGRFSLIA